MRFVIAAQARSDLKSISRYTRKQWGARKATDYVAQIHAKFEAIRRRPTVGVSRPGLERYRAVIAGSHIVYYRLDPDILEIMRVLHQRMDARQHLDA